MRFWMFLFTLIIPSFSAPVRIYLVSGEEFEGSIDSVHSKRAEFNQIGKGRRLVPYEYIVAIRIDSALKTGPFSRIELEKIFPYLATKSREIDRQPKSIPEYKGWEFKGKTMSKPDGHYLTFQGLQSLLKFRPTISANYFWTTKWPVHPTASFCFENWTDRQSPDTSFHGEMYGVGIKGGIRKYFSGRQKWYLEGDLGGFHFFNGMLGGDRAYFGLGPFIGYQNIFEKVVVDVNLGWMHVLNEPQVIPEFPDSRTGFGNLDKAIDLQIQSMESTIKIFYPYMRLEANLALGFKI